MKAQQMNIWEWKPDAAPCPEWDDCFILCKHFDSHEDYPPDYYPGTRRRRCTYCDHKHGTSGKQYKSKLVNNVWHMWCIHFEYGGK